MIDIKKVKLELKMSDSMKVAGCHVLSRETYNDVHNALTELERLQELEQDILQYLMFENVKLFRDLTLKEQKERNDIYFKVVKICDKENKLIKAGVKV
jgi:hypothetical protein